MNQTTTHDKHQHVRFTSIEEWRKATQSPQVAQPATLKKRTPAKPFFYDVETIQ